MVDTHGIVTEGSKTLRQKIRLLMAHEQRMQADVRTVEPDGFFTLLRHQFPIDILQKTVFPGGFVIEKRKIKNGAFHDFA